MGHPKTDERYPVECKCPKCGSVDTRLMCSPSKLKYWPIACDTCKPIFKQDEGGMGYVKTHKAGRPAQK